MYRGSFLLVVPLINTFSLSLKRAITAGQD